MKTEQFLKSERQQLLPASEYPNVIVSIANRGEMFIMQFYDKT
jgi:hypothetical protein